MLGHYHDVSSRRGFSDVLVCFRYGFVLHYLRYVHIIDGRPYVD